MTATIPTDGVEPILGEPSRYFVQSSRAGEPPYLVDLEEFGGVGQCGCLHHSVRITPTLESAQERGQNIPLLRCKHVEAALRYRALERLAS